MRKRFPVLSFAMFASQFLSASLCVVTFAACAGAAPMTLEVDFSTFFGGVGDEEIRELGRDDDGNIILVGTGSITTSDFPNATTFGPLGMDEAFVAKLDSSGSNLLWITLMGGSGQERGYGFDTDPDGNIYVAGQTSSLDLPATTNAWDQSNNGGGCGGVHGCSLDAYAMKLSADGQTLMYLTYLGGSEIDGARGGLAVDDEGYAYITGFTASSNFLDEGGVPNAAKVNGYLGGASDAFLVKLETNGSDIAFARFLGGSDDVVTGAEVAVGAALDDMTNIYVHAIVRSTDAETTNAFQTAFGGGTSDVYFAKFTPDATQLVFATYFGGSGAEFGEHRMTLDGSSNSYYSGMTASADFPLTNAHQVAFGGTLDGYLVKLDAAGQPLISTYLGGVGEDTMFGPAVASDGLIAVSGPSFSTNAPVTSNALDSVFNGSRDVYINIYNATGSLLYATLFGNDSVDEYPRWVMFDTDDRLIIGGLVESATYPVTAGAFDTSFNGGTHDAFVTRFTLCRYDDDCDRLPNAWEVEHFGGVTNALAGEDSDTNGFSNIEEYIADTDPHNPTSYFHSVDMDVQNGTDIAFHGSTNRIYTLQFAKAIMGIWSNVPGQTAVAGSGPNTIMTDTNAAGTSCFFRLKVSVP